MECTIVWQKNWEAVHKVCETCNGTGVVESKPCSWCGNPEHGKNGNGKHWRYIINVGSSRSSKTVSIIDVYDLYARSYSNKRLTAWRDTKTDCRKTVLNDMLKRFKTTNRYKVDQEFNKTESIFTYINQSTVEIHGTDDEETVHGLTQDGAWLNEPYKISKDTFDQIDQRTADFVIVDLNPKKGHWSDDLVKEPRAIVIHSTFKDNPFCPIESEKKILSYQPVSMCEARELKLIPSDEEARHYDFTANKNKLSDRQLRELQRCIDNENKNSASPFKWCVYGLGTKAEKPNRIFSWTKIPRSQYDAITAPVYIGNDWGKNHPWGIIEAKYHDGALYLRELNYLSETKLLDSMTAEQRAEMRKSEVNGENIGIVQWLFAKLKIPYNVKIICDTNRPLKIRALRSNGWTYAKEAIKPAGSIIDGIELLQNLDVYYTDDSPNIEYETENYSYDTDKYGEVTEEPIDADNHLCDPARYIALELQRLGIIKLV